MENDLTLKMRNGCDLELNSCEAIPVIMHRNLLLESVETGRLTDRCSQPAKDTGIEARRYLTAH